MEAAAGKRILIVVAATDTDQLVYLVVIRGDVFVADGPGDLPAVAIGIGEIDIGIAQGDASPHVRLSAASPHADHVEGLILERGVRLLPGVQIKLRRTLAEFELVLHFPGFDVAPEFGAIELHSGIEQEHLDSFSSEVPGGHTAGGAAAYDHDVVHLGGSAYLHVR